MFPPKPPSPRPCMGTLTYPYQKHELKEIFRGTVHHKETGSLMSPPSIIVAAHQHNLAPKPRTRRLRELCFLPLPLLPLSSPPELKITQAENGKRVVMSRAGFFAGRVGSGYKKCGSGRAGLAENSCGSGRVGLRKCGSGSKCGLRPKISIQFCIFCNFI